ncbi:hypothetical protein [Sphingorhabdus pulchriflava]|nr:hypothetical protein [Sphingorhabdus pulchriflava]
MRATRSMRGGGVGGSIIEPAKRAAGGMTGISASQYTEISNATD